MNSRIAAIFSLAALAGTASAQLSIDIVTPAPNAGFIRLGAINADGTKGVGEAELNGMTYAVSWTKAGGVAGPSLNNNWHDSGAKFLSLDGQTTVGFSRFADLNYRAVSWKNGARTEYTLPTGKEEFFLGAIDGTGANMFGWTVPTGTLLRQASRVTSTGQCVVLDQTFPDNTVAGDNMVLGSSSNGSIVFGDANHGAQRWPVRWTVAGNGTSTMQTIGMLPGSTYCSVWGCSADGATAVGLGNSAGIYRAWRWRSSDGMQALPSGPNETMSGAYAVSGNNRVIVGFATVAQTYRGRLWIDGVMYDMADYMQERGVDMSGWSTLSVTAVNPDGSIVAGTGALNGQARAFVAHIRCNADLDFDFQVDLSDFFMFFNAFDSSERAADVTDDGIVDLADFFDFFNHFDAGC